MTASQKVLYIAHFHEGSGWSNAAIANVLALDAAGVDVVPRTVKLGGKAGKLPERFLELLDKPTAGADYCIQHLIPSMMAYNSSFKKCIGMFASETSNFISSGWANYINCMSECWVFCNQQVEACKASGVNIPVRVVPHPCDVSKFDESKRKKIDLGNGGAFTFFTCAEYNTRKNIPAIVRAFHSEFDPSENVSLLLKLNSYSLSRDDLTREILKSLNDIKGKLRIYPSLSDYHGDLIQTSYLPEEDLLDLFYSCDSFINASYGEAFSIPTFDAMGFGKFPLVTEGIGCDYIDDSETGYLIDSTPTLVSSVNDTIPGLFTGKEEWMSISIPYLKRAMRQVFEFKDDERLQEYIKSASKAKLQEYSYTSIGNRMKQFLLN